MTVIQKYKSTRLRHREAQKHPALDFLKSVELVACETQMKTYTSFSFKKLTSEIKLGME